MHSASNSARVLADKFVSTGEAARLLNNSVTPQTINNWANLGQIPFIKTNGGHFRVSRDSIVAMRDGAKPKIVDKKRLVITYCRVSSETQRKDGNLDRQIERVTKYVREAYPDRELIQYSEVGSGFSVENRKQLWKLLENIISGNYDNAVLAVQSRERLSRFLIDIFELLCKRSNIVLDFIENDTRDTDKTFSDDLISVVTYFTVRFSSRKSGKRLQKALGPDCIRKGTEYLKQGLTLRKATEQLIADGFSNPVPSRWLVRRYIFDKMPYLNSVVDSIETSADEFRRTRIIMGADDERIFTADLYSQYEKWCVANGKVLMTKRKMLRSLSDLRATTYSSRFHKEQTSSQTCYAGVKIKGAEALTFKVRNIKRTPSVAEDGALDSLLQFTDTLRGKEITSKKLLAGYKAHCKELNITPLSRKQIFTAVNRVALSVQSNGHGWTYKL